MEPFAAATACLDAQPAFENGWHLGLSAAKSYTGTLKPATNHPSLENNSSARVGYFCAKAGQTRLYLGNRLSRHCGRLVFSVEIRVIGSNRPAGADAGVLRGPGESYTRYIYLWCFFLGVE